MDLGSYNTSNINGVRWVNFLKANSDVQLLGDNVPTHIQGGRLDYVALFHMPFCSGETHLVTSLFSDHFALETSIPFSTASLIPRRRLTVPPDRVPGLLSKVIEWYNNTNDIFRNSDGIYQGLLDVINEYVGGTRTKQKPSHVQLRTYAHDPVILNLVGVGS